MSDDHSELAPLLPIPNRTVKRLCADDSVHSVCESRSSSDSYNQKSPTQCWAFLFVRFENDLFERSASRAHIRPVEAKVGMNNANVTPRRAVVARAGHRFSSDSESVKYGSPAFSGGPV